MSCYTFSMIRTWKHKGLRELFETGRSRRVNPEHLGRAKEILTVINGARTTVDIDLPGYRLHNLAPSRPLTLTIRLRGPWRITFEFRNGDAYDLDYEEYH